jgi:hypothetical protein
LYKEQFSEIIHDAFKSNWKDDELYQLRLETYQQLMSFFNFDKTQTHSGPTFEFGMHGSEEQSEGEKMEVDLILTS